MSHDDTTGFHTTTQRGFTRRHNDTTGFHTTTQRGFTRRHNDTTGGAHDDTTAQRIDLNMKPTPVVSSCRCVPPPSCRRVVVCPPVVSLCRCVTPPSCRCVVVCPPVVSSCAPPSCRRVKPKMTFTFPKSLLPLSGVFCSKNYAPAEKAQHFEQKNTPCTTSHLVKRHLLRHYSRSNFSFCCSLSFR